MENINKFCEIQSFLSQVFKALTFLNFLAKTVSLKEGYLLMYRVGQLNGPKFLLLWHLN